MFKNLNDISIWEIITLYKNAFAWKFKNSFFNVFSLSHFCCFTFKNTPSCSFKYFESSDIIGVKKKNLLKVYYFLLFLFSN